MKGSYVCTRCSKSLASSQSLWNHKQRCKESVGNVRKAPFHSFACQSLSNAGEKRSSVPPVSDSDQVLENQPKKSKVATLDELRSQRSESSKNPKIQTSVNEKSNNDKAEMQVKENHFPRTMDQNTNGDGQSTTNESIMQIPETNAVQGNAMVKTKPQSTNRHKRVKCNVCLRKMRSDNLKRHTQTHQKLHTLDEEEMLAERIKLKMDSEKEELGNMIRQIVKEEFTKHNTKSISEEKESMRKSQFQFTSYITGYYYYRSRWTPYIGQELTTMCEMDNSYDEFAVSIYSNDMIVGHVPRQISPQFTTLLKSGGSIQVKVIRDPFNTGNKGLRIPCIYTVCGKDEEVHMIRTNIMNIE